LGQPRTQTGRLLRALLQDGTRPLHEKPSQVRVPTFANPEQLLLATGGIFARDDAFLKAAPLPIAAEIAVAVLGPIPGIATNRRQASFSPAVTFSRSFGVRQ